MFWKKKKVQKIKFVPHTDISAWELALILPIALTEYDDVQRAIYKNLPQEAKRHFVEFEV